MTALQPIGIGLMCKPPRPGTAKTRLAATLGPEVAAELAHAFLEDTAATVASISAKQALVRHAYYRPRDAAGEITAIIGPDWPQSFCDAGDLGASMRKALGDLLKRTPHGAMIIGSDLPTLPPDHLIEAAHHLRVSDEHTAVIGPSADGGYYLIGVRSTEAWPLFEPMAWSTPDVLSETRKRAKQCGIRLIEINPWYDIDEVDDLARLQADHLLRTTATRHVISRLGIRAANV